MKSAPDILAGYNTMTKEQKEKVDIKGLTTFMSNGLVIIGLTVITGYLLFSLTGFPMIANILVLILILGGTSVLLIQSRKFDSNKQTPQSKLIYIIPVFIILSIMGLAWYGLRPAEIRINSESIRITGFYGVEILKKDLSEVTLTEKIPGILIRTNGLSLGAVNKGNFMLEGFGKCRLFLQSTEGPFLILTDQNGKKTILNFQNRMETEQKYRKLKSLPVK